MDYYRLVFIVAGFIVLLQSAVVAQPGPFGKLDVNVVNTGGNPIRGARVARAIIRSEEKSLHRTIDSSAILIGKGGLFDVGSAYEPRDGRMSSWVGEVVCGHPYEILVSAPGYRSVLKKDRVERCPMELTVTLEPDGSALPSYSELTTVSGQLKGHGGIPLDGWLRFSSGQRIFVPKVAGDGAFMVELLPGAYKIEFSHYKCSQYLINEYRLGSEARTLDLDVNCSPSK